MSLDLVKRLFENPNITFDLHFIVLLAIESNQPEILELVLGKFKLKNLVNSTHIKRALMVSNPGIIRLMLDYYPIRWDGWIPPISRFSFIYYEPLLAFYSNGHSIIFDSMSIFSTYLTNPEKEKIVPMSIDVVRLMINHNTKVEPWMILSCGIGLQKPINESDLSFISTTAVPLVKGLGGYERSFTYYVIEEVLINATKNGDMKLLKCLSNYIWSFEARIFQTAVREKQFKIAYYFGQLFSNVYPHSINRYCIQFILVSFYDIENDDDFDLLWNLFKPLTTNSKMVTEMLVSSTNYVLQNLHHISNTIDRIIQCYTRFYNGPEKEQYQMEPLRLDISTYWETYNLYYLFSKYRNNPIIHLDHFQFEYYFNGMTDCGLIPYE
ncbi:hypothetical protein DFA_08283 [Cavenderia fasciculata]|uniref:Uncharacterized protein n=1 Tax=Cavenderia fasciculata TaxID=261658 RepID=F4Q5N1_CACFS|nr:uncharacterized protein DFA_08283 [Cavenderia fasciculata]EGG17290.1 hypothetical protein DFA_08283 [Cavenderia fasciculata]|eukprot:XP_004355774.1 hypothetical protein DFA_08283 [Cavenderia fasciculata]